MCVPPLLWALDKVLFYGFTFIYSQNIALSVLSYLMNFTTQNAISFNCIYMNNNNLKQEYISVILQYTL